MAVGRIGNISHPQSLPQAPSVRHSAPARPRSGPLRPVRALRRPAKTTVLADRARAGHTSPFPSRARAALQALAALSTPEGGARADRSSDARTLSVAGGRTSARRTIPLAHVGHATPLPPKTRYNSTLHGVQRELPAPAFVSRSPTPSGGAARFGGRGRTARCQRCRDASTPP
jgi:hypothetical protein